MNKKFWATAFTLTGTVIGAGILGLPYVFSQSGFLVGLFWLVFLGLIVMFVNLCLGEVTLKTKKIHQLPGYAKIYLGHGGGYFMFLAMAFGIYSALIAYLIGEGASLSQIFFGNKDYALYFGIGFWAVMTLLLKEGLKGLKKIELYGVIVIIGLILWILGNFIGEVKVSNLTSINYSNFFFPFGVVLFSMLGFTSIPELRREIKGNEKLLKKAIIIGSLIPVILYIIFSFVFIGVLGQEIPEIATLAFGKIVTILGIFTMLTSYFVLSFSLKDIYEFDFNLNKFMSFFFISLFPLLLYLGVSLFEVTGFIGVLGIGGVISGGTTGVLILFMNFKAKELWDRKSEYKMFLNKWLIGILGLIFLLGIFVQLF